MWALEVEVEINVEVTGWMVSGASRGPWITHFLSEMVMMMVVMETSVRL